MLENVIRAFSADHVVRITGLTDRQLRYWDTTGFFQPAYADLGDGKASVRLYSFKDLVGLKVLHVLRSVHRVSLKRLKIAARTLSEYSQTPWSDLSIMVCNREVSFVEPGSGNARSVSGQYVMLPIIDVIRHVDRSIDQVNRRDSDQIGYLARTRNVVHNAEVFAGTRVPARAITRYLEAGYSVDAILKEYPSLERVDVEAVAQRSGGMLAA